jgi:hypothetical protein
MKLLLAGAAVFLALSASAADQQQQAPVQVRPDQGNRYHVLCPKAYRDIPCPKCPTGKKNLCGDIPGITSAELGNATIDHQTCGNEDQGATERMQARRQSISTWYTKAKNARDNEGQVANTLRAQAGPYAGSYPGNAGALTQAADFIDNVAVPNNVGVLVAKLADAKSCLDQTQMANDGCYHSFCGALDGIEEDVAYRLPAALDTITQAVDMARGPADAGLPNQKWVGNPPNQHDVCTDPQVPCVQQMDGAVGQIKQAAVTIANSVRN